MNARLKIMALTLLCGAAAMAAIGHATASGPDLTRFEKVRNAKLKIPVGGIARVAAANTALTSAGSTAFYKLKILYEFKGGRRDGASPQAGLVRDAAGNFYGTTATGGPPSAECSGYGSKECGAVYKLDPNGNETILHFFNGGTDGGAPIGSLLLDARGDLYGTTAGGGDLANNCQCGTVWRIDSHGNFSVIHTFATSEELAPYTGPWAGLVSDRAGNLYGTTVGAAALWEYGVFDGSIFKIDTNGHYSVLHTFAFDSPTIEGGGLYGPLVIDHAGNLYGETSERGSAVSGAGTVFKLDDTGQLTTLYGFMGTQDGAGGAGSVFVDDEGIYGMAYSGGHAMPGLGGGLVFKIANDGRYTVLHKFTGGGAGLGGGFVRDPSGNLYGTTLADGASSVYAAGSVFKMSPEGKVTDIMRFTGGREGGGPLGDVLVDSSGKVYGTTAYGGRYGAGVIYELSPQ